MKLRKEINVFTKLHYKLFGASKKFRDKVDQCIDYHIPFILEHYDKMLDNEIEFNSRYPYNDKMLVNYVNKNGNYIEKTRRDLFNINTVTKYLAHKSKEKNNKISKYKYFASIEQDVSALFAELYRLISKKKLPEESEVETAVEIYSRIDLANYLKYCPIDSVKRTVLNKAHFLDKDHYSYEKFSKFYNQYFEAMSKSKSAKPAAKKKETKAKKPKAKATKAKKPKATKK